MNPRPKARAMPRSPPRLRPKPRLNRSINCVCLNCAASLLNNMSFLLRRFRRSLPLCGCFLAGVFLAGCSHFTYVDPNPTAQFVFPGQNPPTPTGVQGATGVSLAPVNTPPQPSAPQTPTPPHTFAEALSVGDSVTVSFSDVPPPGLLPV